VDEKKRIPEAYDILFVAAAIPHGGKLPGDINASENKPFF